MSFKSQVSSMSVSAIVASLLLVLWLSPLGGAANDPMHSVSVKIAQCRAQCLDKFTSSMWTPNDASCHEEKNCYMCWENCDSLIQNFFVWGHICDDSDLCFPGCQQACGFVIHGTGNGENTVETSPSFMLRFTKPIKFVQRQVTNTLNLSWRRPEGAPSARAASTGENKNVYVVLSRTRLAGHITKWQEVAQTSELATSLDMNKLSPSAIVDFKVMAVTGSGVTGHLVSSYHVSSGVSMQHDKSSLEAPAIISEVGEPIDYTNKDSQHQVVPRWRLHLVALHHNVKLGSVNAVITWAAPGLTGNFLVTWEVKEGTFAITGHLYTDSTTVSLTLTPDTVYNLQVELVSSTLETAQRSEPLTVDTNVAGGAHQVKASGMGEGLNEDDVTMDVAAASDNECTNTLVIASVAVVTSLLLGVVGLTLLCRRYRRKNAVDCAGSVLCITSDVESSSHAQQLQRSCSARRKLSPLPALMPVDAEAGLFNPGTSPIPPPSSSSTDERLSAFRVFLENVERMTESLSPKSDCGSVFPALSQHNISVCHDSTDPGNCSATFGCSRQLRHSREILLSNVHEDDSLCSVFETTWAPTEKLLKGKMKVQRSVSMAI